MRRFVQVAFVLAIIAVIAVGSMSFAAKPKPGPSPCPKDIQCLDIWNPVQCANGVIYSNQCYADRACAPKPCFPVGGGPVEM